MGLNFTELSPEDLKNPSMLNQRLQQITEEVNRLGGSYGPITLVSDLDLNGQRITNVGDAQDSSDVLTQGSADPLYGPQQVQKTLEATGNKMLQTTRRLGDIRQRETTSTFLNNLASTTPASNSSNVAVVAAGGSSNVTVTAGDAPQADGSDIPYASRMDTFVNPGSGSNFYHYYLRVSDATLQYTGPFTSNTSNDRMGANIDGRQYVGTAQINTGGGGSAGGGGDDNPFGCTEIGTPLKFLPGSNPSIEILPCKKWVHFSLEDGTSVAVYPDTLVSVFVRAKELKPGMLVEKEFGKFSKTGTVWVEERDSHKQKVTEPVNKVYYGKGVRFHNTKA